MSLAAWRVAAVVALACPVAAPGRAAQDEVPVARVFERLEGCWLGSGTLFERPASFEMEWRLVWDRRIGILRFGNAFVAADGGRTGVLEAVGYYRTGGDAGGRGTWIDSRGEILALRFTAGDSALTVLWEADSESGRTEYLLRAEERLDVLDHVRVPDGWRRFGRATYRRSECPQ